MSFANINKMGGDIVDERFILVIDDDDYYLKEFEDMLGSKYNVITTNDSIEGLSIILEHYNDIKLLITDIFMPQMNGFELIISVEKALPNVNIPIITLSDSYDQNDIYMSLDLGVSHIIKKPFDETLISHLIDNVLNNYEKIRLKTTADIKNTLQEGREKLHNLLDTVGEAICFCEKIDESYKIFYINDEYKRLFKNEGFSIIESLNAKQINKVFDLKEAVTVKLKIEETSDIYISVRAKEFKYPSRKNPVYMLTAKDITAEKRCEELQNEVDIDPLYKIYKGKKFLEEFNAILKKLDDNGEKRSDYIFIKIKINRFHFLRNYLTTEGLKAFVKSFMTSLKHDIGENSLCGTLKINTIDVFMDKSKFNIQNLISKAHIKYKYKNILASTYLTFGIYELTDTHISAEDVISYTQLALNKVEEDNTILYEYFDEGMLLDKYMAQSYLSDFYSSIDNEDFKVFLQPVFDTSTNSIMSAEALIRWQHPKYGTLEPKVFIDLFEKNGLIMYLDKYVCKKVCETLAEREGAGLENIPISVNISRHTLFHMNFCKYLKSLLDIYKISPALLRIEITDSEFSHTSPYVMGVITDLQNMGFDVVIDNMGNTMFFLNLLREIPVNCIKMDMSELNTIMLSKRESTMLRSLIDMSRLLDIPFVAKGVETREQIVYLNNLDCRYIQGYYISTPFDIDGYSEDKMKSIENSCIAEGGKING